MHILIIEDEEGIAESIHNYLSKNNFRCDIAFNFEQAMEKINLYSYDCIMVDVMLPDGNGLEVVRELKKKHSRSGVIIVSANNALDDRIKGLDIGADDYLTKPFYLPELSARINSILRRRKFDGEQEVIFNEIRLLPEDRLVFVADKILDLTPKEYDLLLFLLVTTHARLAGKPLPSIFWAIRPICSIHLILFIHMLKIYVKKSLPPVAAIMCTLFTQLVTDSEENEITKKN